MTSRGKRILRRVAIVLAVLYALSCLAVALLYRRFLYWPRPAHVFSQKVAPAEKHRLGSDGVDAVTLFCRGNDDGPVVVYFHGNSEAAGDDRWFATDCTPSARPWAAVEYRGYGLSAAAGSPTEKGIYADAEAGLAMLRDEGFGEDRTVLVGFSLGTGVAVEMASRGHGRALLLLAPFTSIPRVLDRWAFMLPTRLLVGDRYDSLSKASTVHVPTLIVHGDADRVVPYAMGVELSQAITGATLLTMPGAGHNDLFVYEPTKASTTMDAFIATAGAAGTPKVP